MHLRFNDDRATTQVARHHLMAELMLVSRLNTIVLRNKIDDNSVYAYAPDHMQIFQASSLDGVGRRQPQEEKYTRACQDL